MLRKLTRLLKIVKRSALMNISIDLEYRTQLIAWIISDSIQPLILALVWSGAAINSGFTSENIFTYFILMTLILKFTKDYSDREVSSSIIYGQFSNYLIKPYNYLLEILGKSIGSKLTKIFFIFPFWLIVVFLIRDYISINLTYSSIAYTVLAIILAFLISFIFGNIFALLTFFIKQIYGLRIFYENLVVFLSGEIMPIFTLPLWFFNIYKYIPFRYTLSFPVEILGGFIDEKGIYEGFIYAIVWLIISIIIYIILYSIARKKYEGEGI